ncbi:MAG TPA: hypothetical protein VJM31_14995 [Vicinamibacterales bacterium]|nr:hypothetical protein [Vicinamibacterales bacterium]
MTDRHPSVQNSRLFLAKCAAVLPAVWLALFLIALPFPGGHPSLPALVAVIPASLSLMGRAAGWLMGDPGTSSVSLAVLVLGTVVELGFIGAVAGVGARRLSNGRFPGQSVWLSCFFLYVACHTFGSALVTSRAGTGVVLSVGSTGVRHGALQRIAEDGDRRYRETLLSALEKGSEPDVDEEIIATLTLLEDGAFWHSYLTSPRGSRWGISLWAKVLCDISNKGPYLRQKAGVDFALLTESFATLNTLMFERMVAELPNRPELLNPIFDLGLNNPSLGRAMFDRLFELLQRPSIAKCVRLGMSYRDEWRDPSHPKHRLYVLANATCQDFSKSDLELWLSQEESPEGLKPAPLNAAGLCQFVINSEGWDRKGEPR